MGTIVESREFTMQSQYVERFVNLLEPQSADGLVAWNYLDKSLEGKVKTFPIVRVETQADLKTD